MTAYKKDMRANPVKTIVALGESHTWGYSVSDKEECWVNRVTRLIENYQGEKVRLINQGIGSNIVTPLCPAYPGSVKPCALERVDGDVVAHNPDLVFLAYGLNDSRGGTPVEVFRSEYQKLIDRLREKTSAVIVMLNVFYMHECMYQCFDANWNYSNYDVTEMYNKMLEQLAHNNDIILADVYSMMKGADWIIDLDHCHPNALGHQLIANKVFEAIATNASFVSATAPKEANIIPFIDKYGNGPQIESCHDISSDILLENTRKAMQNPNSDQ